jgi:hypothetical protein
MRRSPSARQAEFGAKAPVRSLLECPFPDGPIDHLSDRLGRQANSDPATAWVRSPPNLNIQTNPLPAGTHGR